MPLQGETEQTESKRSFITSKFQKNLRESLLTLLLLVKFFQVKVRFNLLKWVEHYEFNKKPLLSYDESS
jgi:hypothetical protein